MTISRLPSSRLDRAKKAYTTRRASVRSFRTLVSGDVAPETGDFVLARVDEIGKQKRIELSNGRRAHLFPGDEVIVCFGNRYAPDQYEAQIGSDLSTCDLVAAGGVAAHEISRHDRMINPTRITPIGLIGDADGRKLNLRDFRISEPKDQPAVPIVLSLGTSMNAGKTLTATSIVRGLKLAGHRVAAIKGTGTGAGSDLWIMRDAGADLVLDFTDAGFSSTYLVPYEQIKAGIDTLLRHAAHAGCKIAVVEIADGLQHLETATLVETASLWPTCLGVVFAAYDSMGAERGVDILQRAGHHVLAISGRLTQSPLAMQEAQRATGLPILTPWQLQAGSLNPVVTTRHAAMAADKTRMKAKGHEPSASGAKRSEETIEQLRVTAEQLMAIEIAVLCGAPHGARSPKRNNRRNGFRTVHWQTAIGPIALRVPRVRKGYYRPTFLPRRSAAMDEWHEWPNELRAVMLGSAHMPDSAGSRQRDHVGLATAPKLGHLNGVATNHLNGARLPETPIASAALALQAEAAAFSHDDEDEEYLLVP